MSEIPETPANPQLDKLKRRIPGATNNALLQDMLDDAGAFILNHTGQLTIPTGLLPAQVTIAAAKYNRLGLEGQSAHSEGGVSIAIDMLPADLVDELGRYTQAKVGW